uniref:UDP-glycosyltransferases domain-containing protein n=1 Tax=Kalanchoe fedtschenkoi TaxID=63787 RepID=A0A7N0T6J3_KALFE
MPDLRLKDLPSVLRTTDPNDILFYTQKTEVRNCLSAPTILINTYDDLEPKVLDGLKKLHPRIHPIGPLSLLSQRYTLATELKSFNSSLWKEDAKCVEWLSGRAARSVVYVNYGSVTTMSYDRLKEFAWGLAGSGQAFLWVVRSDVLGGDSVELGGDFLDEIEGRGLVVSWCPQEEVLSHPSVGAFLTHCGWNSMLESLSAGVPMICWPNYFEQHTNARYACTDWGVGLELGAEAERGEIAEVVREMMGGGRGVELRENAGEWKRRGEAAIDVGGSSYTSFEQFISEVIQPKHQLAGTQC